MNIKLIDFYVAICIETNSLERKQLYYTKPSYLSEKENAQHRQGKVEPENGHFSVFVQFLSKMKKRMIFLVSLKANKSQSQLEIAHREKKKDNWWIELLGY